MDAVPRFGLRAGGAQGPETPRQTRAISNITVASGRYHGRPDPRALDRPGMFRPVHTVGSGFDHETAEQ
jgi:hypothetical protein